LGQVVNGQLREASLAAGSRKAYSGNPYIECCNDKLKEEPLSRWAFASSYEAQDIAHWLAGKVQPVSSPPLSGLANPSGIRAWCGQASDAT
jgi:hypothetical protein